MNIIIEKHSKPIDPPVIKCVVCKNVIPYAGAMRKFCRNGDCRELFKKLKYVTKSSYKYLSDEHKEVHKQLVNEGHFPKL